MFSRNLPDIVFIILQDGSGKLIDVTVDAAGKVLSAVVLKDTTAGAGSAGRR